VRYCAGAACCARRYRSLHPIRVSPVIVGVAIVFVGASPVIVGAAPSPRRSLQAVGSSMIVTALAESRGIRGEGAAPTGIHVLALVRYCAGAACYARRYRSLHPISASPVIVGVAIVFVGASPVIVGAAPSPRRSLQAVGSSMIVTALAESRGICGEGAAPTETHVLVKVRVRHRYDSGNSR
jgi:hypothetical protein